MAMANKRRRRIMAGAAIFAAAESRAITTVGEEVHKQQLRNCP